MCCSVFQCAAVCFSVLQYAAVCCSDEKEQDMCVVLRQFQ